MCIRIIHFVLKNQVKASLIMTKTRRWRPSSEKDFKVDNLLMSTRRQREMLSSPAKSTRSQARGRHKDVSPKHKKPRKSIPQHAPKSPLKSVVKYVTHLSPPHIKAFSNTISNSERYHTGTYAAQKECDDRVARDSPSEESWEEEEEEDQKLAASDLMLKSTADESNALLTMHPGQKLTKMSVQYQHDKCGKEHLFPKLTFISSKSNLQFSNNQNSICRYMAERLMIQDNGMGMSPEIIAQLFQIDKNTHRAGTSKEQGTGLGLILTKELVELNRGQINVTSEVGKGTTFSMAF